MRRYPSILHADLDAFFASVEQRDDPRLRGRPVIVGGGVVMAASYEARARGVRSAMGGVQARRLCPDAVVVPPRLGAYSEASAAVFAVFEATTPLVEGISIDEAFLDVGGLRRTAGTPREIAVRLRSRVRDEVGLAITVGAATTKFLAKVASAVAKPDGLLVVAPGTELAFLHPLPVERLWGVGPVTAATLHARGITTVGEVAQIPESALVATLGPAAGRHLCALAHNRDPRAVTVGRRRRSVGAQHALGRRRRTAEEIDAVLVGLVDRVTRRLRDGGRVGRTVTVRLRFDDFGRATRSHTLAEATGRTDVILAAARDLLAAASPTIERRGLTLVGVAIGNLAPDSAVQLALPFSGEGPGGLDAALDAVRTRFGTDALGRAVHLGRDLGLEMPVLPDGERGGSGLSRRAGDAGR
ncbi:MAG TPA: DNA polymerase IV [Acidimicrobiales bacterium]|nr:DNA polymerase IV [Acidimicrobiales bacterium]